MDRLTTDNRETNLQTLLNYAYAKDKAVHLVFGNDEDDIPLDEYIAHEAREHGCPRTTTEVMEGACMECDCPIAILNAVSIQAAELRARLKMIEDILGDTYDLDHLRELMEVDNHPVKPRSTIYINGKAMGEYYTSPIRVVDVGTRGVFLDAGDREDHICELIPWDELGLGTEIFLTKEEAKAALDKDNNVPTKKEDM